MRRQIVGPHLRDKVAATVTTDDTRHALVANDLMLEDSEQRCRSTRTANGDDTYPQSEIADEDYDVIITVHLESNQIDVHGYEIPGMFTSEHGASFTTGMTKTLTSHARRTAADILTSHLTKTRHIETPQQDPCEHSHARVPDTVVVNREDMLS